MTPRRQTPLVLKVRQGLIEIRPLMGIAEGVEISEKTVRQIGEITDLLIQSIGSKAN
jgi:hypothetical protein